MYRLFARDRSWPDIIQQNYYVIIPVLLVFLYTAHLLWFMIPNSRDVTSESYEPIKTLKFFHSKGKSFHKWGPMPCFVYGPVYAPFLGYWVLSKDVGKISEDYPYGLKRPFEQIGALIVAGRAAGLATMVICMAIYAVSLHRLTGSRRAAFLAVLLCLATSPEILGTAISTRPDGMMLSFLMVSMAAYAVILRDGLNWKRGLFLSLFAVFSISCKELTALVFVLPYLGLGLAGLIQSSREPGSRRGFLANFGFTVAAGLLAYALCNVVYAPAIWAERMKYWLVGEGKDPAIWAPSNYTSMAYLREALEGLLLNFGYGGLAIVCLSLLVLAVFPVKHRILLVLPSLGFLSSILLTAGYMPAYFLSPLNVTLTLPVASMLAFADQRWFACGSRLMRTVVTAMMVVLCTSNILNGNFAWFFLYCRPDWSTEQYCLRSVGRNELIHTGSFNEINPNSHRLEYLGFHVNERSLFSMLVNREEMPSLIILPKQGKKWLDQFAERPMRAKLVSSTLGITVNRLPDLETIGYRLVETLRPEVPRLLQSPLVPPPWTNYLEGCELLIYRKASTPAAGLPGP